jgi:hypothetical protein
MLFRVPVETHVISHQSTGAFSNLSKREYFRDTFIQGIWHYFPKPKGDFGFIPCFLGHSAAVPVAFLMLPSETQFHI